MICILLTLIKMWYIIQSCLNEDLLNISKWLIANKLTLNMTRTEFMLIDSRQKLNTLTASPDVLSINAYGTLVTVSTSKSLGVLIDANLTWGSLIETFASGIAAIKRVRQFVLPPPPPPPPPQQHCILSTKPWFSLISTIVMLFGETAA